MTARIFATSQIAAVLLAMTVASAAQAQGPLAGEFDGLYDGHDLQFFRPTDLDFEGRPYRRDAGFFFRYDKLSWSFTGERTRVGTTNAQAASQNSFREFDEGGVLAVIDDEVGFIPGTTVIVAPLQRVSGINNSPPSSEFAWGNRYELGHFQDDDGWIIGILDGPEAVSNETYGFGFTGQDDTVTDGGVGLPSPFPGTPPNQLINPLGSVYVAFNIPVLNDRGTPDPSDDITLMHGYLDVDEADFVDGSPGGANAQDANGDGVLNGDGFADDINQNGLFGPDGFPGDADGTEPDTQIVNANTQDLGDLVLLPTSWQTLQVINQTETQGIEIMKTYRLPNRYRMAKNQNNNLEIMYGARYLRLNDRFGVFGTGGVLGTSFWDTFIENHIVGPQIAVNYKHQRGKFTWDWNGRFLAGYNIQNWDQEVGLGEDLIEGQHNHPLYFAPTYSNHGRQDNEFSPVAEMRVQLSYQLTNALALKLGYNALLVDNIRRAAQQVDYTLPNLGFIDGGTSEIFINGVNFGFEAVY